MGVVQGYEKSGFRREGNTVVYREWCPAATSAQLIGDFNGWGGTHMEEDGLGVWKAVLPDGNCLPSLHEHDAWLPARCQSLYGSHMLQIASPQPCRQDLFSAFAARHKACPARPCMDPGVATARTASYAQHCVSGY